MPDQNRKPYTSDKRLANYNRVLSDLLLAGVCSRSALSTSARKTSATYSSIQRAIEIGHIRQGHFRELYGNRNRDQKFLTISQKGLAYLSQQKGQPWWKFISADTGLIIPFADRHSDRVAVATRQGNALLMALHMGANVTEWVFLEEPLIPLKSTLSDQEDGDKEDDWSEGIDYFEFFDNEVEISPPKEYAEAVFDDADLEGIDLFDANTETPNALLSAVRADTYNRAEAMGEIIIDQQNKKLFFFPKREVGN